MRIVCRFLYLFGIRPCSGCRLEMALADEIKRQDSAPSYENRVTGGEYR